MKRIILSLLLVMTVKVLAEDTNRAISIYEYRPQILIKLDSDIENPQNRWNLKELNLKYNEELDRYLGEINYDSDKIFFLANEYFLLNNYAKANKIFLKDNTDIKNIFGAATTYRFMGENEKAVQKYTEAISHNSSFPESFLGRALANRNMDNYDSAINDLKKYISMTSRLEGYIALSDIYFKIGQNKDAYNIVNSGLSKYPSSKILREIRANILKNKLE